MEIELIALHQEQGGGLASPDVEPVNLFARMQAGPRQRDRQVRRLHG